MSIAFLGAAWRYWFGVYPLAARLLRRIKRRASEIENPRFRELALTSLSKRGNMEGAAAFAVLASRRHRRATVEALVIYQAIYNYTDMLSEQPAANPERNARRAHEALVDPFTSSEARNPGYYYEYLARASDGEYLDGLVLQCRRALAELPGATNAAPVALRAADRIRGFQQATACGSTERVRLWAVELEHDDEFSWLEMAASAGSSLLAHAAIGVSGGGPDPALGKIEHVYFPAIGALHSFLDSLVDAREDAQDQQLSLIGCYRTPDEARARMSWLAGRAARSASLLDDPRHSLLFAGMVAYYLSEIDRSDPFASSIAKEITGQAGPLVGAALLVFRVRRALVRLGRYYASMWGRSLLLLVCGWARAV